MSCSVNASSPKAADEDETFINMKHRLQFADSIKDLKNLRKQLFSAAEYFESSYNKDNHKQLYEFSHLCLFPNSHLCIYMDNRIVFSVVESSKDYVAKALVNTVDHLGSVADKLNKFLDEKANECSAITTQFSCIQQRLCTIQGFVGSRGMSQHLFQTKDNVNNKHNIIPSAQTLGLEKSNVLYGNRFSSLPDDVHQPKQARMKPLTRKQESRMPLREASPNPPSFSFTKMRTNNEAGRRRSVSPLALPLNLASKRSVSPNPSFYKGQRASEPRRAVSACRARCETRNGEMEVESYTKKSRHLLKALLSLHHSRKVILHKQIQG